MDDITGSVEIDVPRTNPERLNASVQAAPVEASKPMTRRERWGNSLQNVGSQVGDVADKSAHRRYWIMVVALLVIVATYCILLLWVYPNALTSAEMGGIATLINVIWLVPTLMFYTYVVSLKKDVFAARNPSAPRKPSLFSMFSKQTSKVRTDPSVAQPELILKQSQLPEPSYVTEEMKQLAMSGMHIPTEPMEPMKPIEPPRLSEQETLQARGRPILRLY